MADALVTAVFDKMSFLANLASRCALLLAACLVYPAAHAITPPSQPFIALSYHDVRYDVRAKVDPDQVAISVKHLTEHFAWLKTNGYQPVDIDTIIASQNGGPPLPDKAILLTFDDGYVSFYDIVYPLLKLYDFPAVAAVVTGWLETPTDLPVQYGKRQKHREDFLTWQQVREMQSSGLVEMACHSHDLHRAAIGNPQGNELPMATTRAWSTELQRYETEAQYRERIGSDLKTCADTLALRTGSSPRVMVWPYGAHSGVAKSLAANAGMTINVTLEDGSANAADLSEIPRILVLGNPPISDLIWSFIDLDKPTPTRAAFVEMDGIYDDDPQQFHANLSALLDQIKDLALSVVYVNPLSVNTSTSYFPTAQLPVRDDVFSWVAWQLASRANVDVYAWLHGGGDRAEDRALKGGGSTVSLVDDLTRHTVIRGLLLDTGRDSPATPYLVRKILNTARQYRGEFDLAMAIHVDEIEQVHDDVTLDRIDAALTKANQVVLMLNPDKPSRRAKNAVASLSAWLAPIHHGLNHRVVIAFGPQTNARQGERYSPDLPALEQNLRLFHSKGFTAFAYFAGDITAHQSKLDVIRRSLALRRNPYAPGR